MNAPLFIQSINTDCYLIEVKYATNYESYIIVRLDNRVQVRVIVKLTT